MSGILSRLKRSLATRLLLVFLLTGALLSLLIIPAFLYGLSAHWKSNIRPHLAQYLDYINADIGNPPDLARARQLALELPINIYVLGPGTNFSSTGRPLDLGDLEFHRDWRRKHKRSDNYKTPFPDLQFGEHQDRTVLRNQIGDYQVYYELSHFDRRGHHRSAIGWIIPGVLALLGGCFLVIRYMLRPVQDLKLATHRMGEGELSHRVPVRSNNDLGELAGSINTMADDIEKMLDAKRQLLLGASHELRSPLTRASVAVQLLDDSSYARQIRDDLREMDTLITEILETERINTRHAVLNRTGVNIPSLAQSIIAELGPAEVKLSTVGVEDNLQLDEPRVHLLLRNLISNAIKHGGDADRSPELQVTVTGKTVRIDMTDYGPGIAAEHLSQVTEPFYRIDPARARATGGFGIGLYLCKLIAEAHGGELTVCSEPGTKTVVSAVLET